MHHHPVRLIPERQHSMAKQKHIGLVIFSICSALSARIALFDPKPHVPTAAEERWGLVHQEEDSLGLIHGLRYYIYGIGVVGLLLVAEDYVNDALRKKKSKETNQTPQTTRTFGPRD